VPLSKLMMAKVCSQIKESWLDSAVPVSLDDMIAFRKAIAMVNVFADNLEALKWSGAGELHDWVTNAPRIWLTKRRETSLDWTRNQLSLGQFLRALSIPFKAQLS
jgi:centromere/kinetochore protein ZW10